VKPTIEAVGYGNAAALPPATRVLSADTAALTRDVLRRAVTEGTGRKADSRLYALFGKTGTAQLPDAVNGGFHQNRYVSSFVGGAPVDDPRLVIGCFIRDPDKTIGHYGGVVSAPPVMRVMEQSLQYLGVPTMQPDPPAAQLVLTR